MKSSTGERYIALDHLRAFAAMLVFFWHFLHGTSGSPVLFNAAPLAFPLVLFDEGHTGVALFMALSGYLFAKLLDGRRMNFWGFLRNRALRLLPLLTIVVVAAAIPRILSGQNPFRYFRHAALGIVLPTLPNGGWSITAEFHFYLLLPLLLLLFRKSKLLPIGLVLAAIALRAALYGLDGQVQIPAYWTIIGRIDQFALGMLLFHGRQYVRGKHQLMALVLLSFTLFYWNFDRQGGFYNNPSYPSNSPLWILMPTIEGFTYALLIAWYESSFKFGTRGISRFIGQIGAYSYSIYLLHFFVVFQMAAFVHRHVMRISNFYLASAWAILGFLALVPVGYLSYRFIEAPFLRRRRSYVTDDQSLAASAQGRLEAHPPGGAEA